MKPVRLVARPMLAGIFIGGGLDVLRHPEPRAELARPVVERLHDSLEMLPGDPVAAVRANAIVHVVAGGMLALGILPRVAALTLAGSLVPTTFGGHRFWELDDPQQRAQQQSHFLKNAAILGGLLLAALD
ncbi:MAG TPA: DoxX family protein [Candidatus Dormibacteraeota bacterium]